MNTADALVFEREKSFFYENKRGGATATFFSSSTFFVFERARSSRDCGEFFPLN